MSYLVEDDHKQVAAAHHGDNRARKHDSLALRLGAEETEGKNKNGTHDEARQKRGTGSTISRDKKEREKQTNLTEGLRHEGRRPREASGIGGPALQSGEQIIRLLIHTYYSPRATKGVKGSDEKDGKPHGGKTVT